MLLRLIKVRPCVQSLEYCNHLVPNQRSVSNERVSEWTDFFRVGSKHRRPTENKSSRDNLIIGCKLITSISTVRGIICGNRSYQILPQPISEGLYIYSVKSSYVLLHRFQCLGPVLWDNSRYNSGVLVGFPHVPLMVHSAGLGELNICVCARAPNHFGVLDVINHAL